MDIESLKRLMQRDFLRFSIVLTTISSVLPAKAASLTNSDKQPDGISISALPQKDSNESTINLSDSVANNSDLARKYLEQLKTPLSLESGRLDIIENHANISRVGDLNFLALNMRAKKQENKNQQHKSKLAQPKDLIKHSNIHLVDENNPIINKDALAVCNNVNGNIYLKVFNQNDSSAKQATAQGIQGIEEYKAGNIVAMISTLIHESVHLKHNLYDNMKDLRLPADIYRANRATEKMAYAAQNLYAAQLYTIMKDNGISAIEINGEARPCESVLDFYPGLKDYVLQNGFSANSQKDVDAISKIATNYWNANRQNGYRIQNTLAASMRYSADNIFETVKTDKKLYDSTIDKMLKNVYIGNNTNVNLSRELFDDYSFEDALKAMDNIGIVGDLTIGKIQEIDAYLTGKNITDDTQKVDYLKNQFDRIVLRNGDQDDGLLKILLDTNTENKGTIIYADGLTEKRLQDKHTVTGEYGEANINLHNHFTNLKNKVLGVSKQSKFEPIKQSVAVKNLINKNIHSY